VKHSLVQIDADRCDVHGDDPPDVNCRVGYPTLGQFASIDLVTLVALFEQWDLARIADQNLGHMRLE
jgi:hypothetical protein